MANAVPDLWPESVDVDVISPLVILRHQATALRKRTKNLLEADIHTSTLEPHPASDPFDDDARVQHELRIVVPALDRYSYSLLRVWHRSSLPYPVTIVGWGTAASEDEFMDLLSKALASPDTMSIIHSLIAQTNERIDESR